MDARDVAAFLAAHGIAGEVVILPEPTPTVEAAARAAGTTADRIAKSVLFLAAGAPVLVVAGGAGRIAYKRVAEHLGVSRKQLKLADAPAVLAVTGFPVGAVPPFGHPARLRTLLDAGLLAQPEVFAGGGALNALLRIAPAEIARVAAAEVADIAAPPEGRIPSSA